MKPAANAFARATLLLFLSILPPYSFAQKCSPAPAGVAELVENAAKYFRIDGPLADFDPCHKSVEFSIPPGIPKPPLMIISHGGSGLSAGERNAALAFRELGFATLIYDAYETNGLYKPAAFWATRVINAARQSVNYKVTLGAYRWALTEPKIDNTRIFFYGLSNGAATVTNIAAVVDSSHVKGIFAEGLVNSGFGLPDNLNVPLRLIMGRLENYGGRTANEWRWEIKEKCRVNRLSIQPKGNAENCNFNKNPDELVESAMEWYERQRIRKGDIEMWWLDDAAHGVFSGPISRDVLTFGPNDVRFAWTGGTSSARAQLISRIKDYVARP